MAEVWREVLAGEPPSHGPFLRLSPARHGTDGFFLAVLERKPKPAAAARRAGVPEEVPAPEEAGP